MTDEKPTTPPVDASLGGLVLSLSAAALAYMGKQLAPGTPKTEPNLSLAEHTIKTIEMLKAKTEGNRTEEENKLLDELLYQLRLSYVKASEEKPAPAAPAEAGGDEAAREKQDGE